MRTFHVLDDCYREILTIDVDPVIGSPKRYIIFAEN